MRNQLYEFDKREIQNLRRIIVVGDVHGDYYSISSLLNFADLTKDGIIFLGDYADRGPKGVEVIDTVNSLLKKYPKNVVALKGNHEDYIGFNGEPKFSPCTLTGEARAKKGSWEKYFENEFKPFLENLYLTAIIPDEILFVHGGISSRIKNLDDLRHPTGQIEEDLLWSDPNPSENSPGEGMNARGAGVVFGKKITEDVCNALNVKRIVRSHEPRKAFNGPCYDHDGKVVTISSTNVYNGKSFALIVDSSASYSLSHYFL